MDAFDRRANLLAAQFEPLYGANENWRLQLVEAFKEAMKSERAACEVLLLGVARTAKFAAKQLQSGE